VIKCLEGIFILMSEEFLLSRVILTEDECNTIKTFILTNEDKVKSLGPDTYSGTSSDSLTGRFMCFNFLNTDEVGSVLLKKLFPPLAAMSKLSLSR